METTNRLLLGIPDSAIPSNGSRPRQMLELYLTGEQIAEQFLCDEFGRNYRSVLQRLRGDDFNFWRFIEIRENNVIEARYLDPRHLSGSYDLDQLARAERRKELRADSHTEAMLGASRVQKAFEELREADKELVTLQKENAQQKPSV